VLLYGLMAIAFFVTNATGMTWRTGDIYETAAPVTIYGMGFIAVLALLRIAQRRIAQRRTAVTGVTTEVRAARRAEADPPRLSA
jgi:flagellar biosynthesis/type III secretory pathway M-ring protein FliF/YscJ